MAAIVSGFILICLGMFHSAFWFAEPDSSPIALFPGVVLHSGDIERASGIVLLLIGMVLIYRGR